MIVRRGAALGLLLGLLLTVPAAPARAEFAIGLEAVTDVPLDVAARVWLELPLRIRLSASLGWMPEFYAGGYNAIAQSLKGYDASTGTLVQNGISNSMVGRGHIGWHPWGSHGLYIDAGYSIATFGKGLALDTTLANAFKGQPPPTESSNVNGYDASTVMHMVDLEVGWQWKVVMGFTIRLAAGVSWAVATTTSLKPAFDPKDPTATSSYSSSVSDYLNGKYQNMILPTASLALGWKIF